MWRIAWAAAAAHHVTLLFGAVLFAVPVLFLALIDRNAAPEEEDHASVGGVLGRAVVFAVLGVAGVVIVLLPYWIALMKNPINQMPIPHGSRDNYILNPFSGINFWIIPMGALILAIPFILLRGSAERRLRPLLIGWYCDDPARPGRHDSGRQGAAGPCLQGADLRALHLLGDTDGDAVRRPAGVSN